VTLHHQGRGEDGVVSSDTRRRLGAHRARFAASQAPTVVGLVAYASRGSQLHTRWRSP
jgi:hypothetical protein